MSCSSDWLLVSRVSGKALCCVFEEILIANEIRQLTGLRFEMLLSRLAHICVSINSHERADFCERFWQGQMPLQAPQAVSALYANLVKVLFARF